MGRVGLSRGPGPRIVAHTLSYPPHRRIGAELATHGLLNHLADSGWRSVVVPHTVRGLRPARVDDVHVVTPELARHARPDVVLAHVPFLVRAREMADQWGVPLVVSAHGGPPGWLAAHTAGSRPDLVIANSGLMAVGLARTGAPVHILRPPIDWPTPWPGPDPDGLAVTLVSASAEKGAGLVAELAKRHPDIPFLVVRGGYGAQVAMTGRNVTVLPHGTPMDQVWSMTRLLLVPSAEESWGMVAVEAMARGIPVLASRAQGLSECVGPGMPSLDIADPDAWSARLGLAYDDPSWSDLHIAALRRAAELDPAVELEQTRIKIAAVIGREGDRMETQTFRNVRTKEVVTLAVGTRMHGRLRDNPLVWQPADVGSAAGTATPGPAVARQQVVDPTSAFDAGLSLPPVVRPKRTAPVADWISYAVARGADRAAAAAAPRATLIALYGD